jgi:hypothetical protein
MNRVHSDASSVSIPVEGRSYVRDGLQRMVEEEDDRFAQGKTDRNSAAKADHVAWMAARLALINAQRLDDLTAHIKDTTHDR